MDSTVRGAGSETGRQEGAGHLLLAHRDLQDVACEAWDHDLSRESETRLNIQTFLYLKQ